MKKVLYLTASVLELALLIGAWVVNYFTNKKMGMMRYVVFKNNSWNQKYPLDMLKIMAIISVIVLTAVILVLLWKKLNQAGVAGKLPLVETAAISAVYTVFTLFWSVQKLRAFYFISGMLLLACVIQIIKAALFVFFTAKAK